MPDEPQAGRRLPRVTPAMALRAVAGVVAAGIAMAAALAFIGGSGEAVPGQDSRDGVAVLGPYGLTLRLSDAEARTLGDIVRFARAADRPAPAPTAEAPVVPLAPPPASPVEAPEAPPPPSPPLPPPTAPVIPPPAPTPAAPVVPPPAPTPTAPLIPPPAPTPTPPPAVPAPSGLDTSPMNGYEQAFFDATNRRRIGSGLAPLAANANLVGIARLRSQDMAAYGYFAHTSPVTGDTAFSLMDAYGVAYGWAGENLAKNNYPDADAVAVAEESLWESAPHRENILNPNYRQAGIALVTDASGMKYFTIVFTD